MSFVSKPSDIWEVTLQDADILKGIDYGIISRAWTYDRMGAQNRGDFGKAIFRIAVGRAIQSALEGILAKTGFSFERDATDYKQEDYWDVRLPNGKSVDIKSFHVFSDYKVKDRGRLTRQAVANSTAGETWSTFFPMLIPQDQFDSEQKKDYYIFAIIEAPSSKRVPGTREKPKFLLTLPYSRDKYVNERYLRVHRRKYTNERVKSGETFSMEVARVDPLSLIPTSLRLTIGYGDIQGNACRKELTLDQKKKITLDGMTALHYLRLHEMSSVTSEYLLRVLFMDVDDEGDIEWIAGTTSFEDIWVYDATVYFVGWISKDEFAKARQKYAAFAPNEGYSGNTKHRDTKAQGLMSRKSFCYFYPPVFRGGTQNPNYYCLPQDLHIMDSFVELS